MLDELDVAVVIGRDGELLLERNLEGGSKAVRESGNLDVVWPGILRSSLIEKALKPGDVCGKALFTLADVCEFVASLLLYVGVVVDSLQKGEDCLMVPSLGGFRGIKKRKRQTLLSYLKPIPNVVERVLSCHSICSDLRSHGRQPGAQQIWLAIKLGRVRERMTRGGRRRRGS